MGFQPAEREIDIDILPNKTYRYKVQSFNQGGESEFSNPISFFFPNILLGKWYRDYEHGRNYAFTFYNDMTFLLESNNPFGNPTYKTWTGIYNFSLIMLYLECLEGYDDTFNLYFEEHSMNEEKTSMIISSHVYDKIE